MNEFNELNNTDAWHRLVNGAIRAIEAEGYKAIRLPGRGRSNIFNIELNGVEQIASIRTTRDRWIAFPPLNGGWKTLDMVDVVIISAVDDPEDPKNTEVFILPSDEVKERFDDCYNARIKAGQTVRENFGMWVCLDIDDRGLPASVGSGIVKKHKPISVIPLSELTSSDEVRKRKSKELEGLIISQEPQTIAEVLTNACSEIARISGVDSDKVKLDLKIES